MPSDRGNSRIRRQPLSLHVRLSDDEAGDVHHQHACGEPGDDWSFTKITRETCGRRQFDRGFDASPARCHPRRAPGRRPPRPGNRRRRQSTRQGSSARRQSIRAERAATSPTRCAVTAVTRQRCDDRKTLGRVVEGEADDEQRAERHLAQRKRRADGQAFAEVVEADADGNQQRENPAARRPSRSARSFSRRFTSQAPTKSSAR